MKGILQRFLELGILIKRVDGGLRARRRVFARLSFTCRDQPRGFLLCGRELKEEPTDLVANLLLHTTQSAIEVRVPASVFLIVHGIVKQLQVLDWRNNIEDAAPGTAIVAPVKSNAGLRSCRIQNATRLLAKSSVRRCRFRLTPQVAI